MPPKRAKSAYFEFCHEHRDAAREECLAQDGENKASVAAVAKVLAAKWRALSDEDKEAYKKRAAAEAVSAPEAEAQGAEQEEEGGENGSKLPFGFPLASVKRIMKLDAEVTSISNAAAEAVAKAAELIVQAVVREAARITVAHNRTKVTFSDIETAVERHRCWHEAGLLNLFKHDPIYQSMKTSNTGAHRPKKPAEDPKAQRITTFFAQSEK